METAGYRGKSRRRGKKGRKKKDREITHFQTVRFGGFDEIQMICYLWEAVKFMEAVEAGREKLSSLERQIRSRVRVEMRRYFARKKRRNVVLVISGILAVVCTASLFGFVIGMDRVSGDSMYPYLNNGDWIVYSRVGREYQMDEVVVFARNGENYVKRIAGRPGDTVEVSASGSRVVVNGVQMRESYVTLTAAGTGSESQKETDRLGEPLTIMDGQYLVLGDNRSISIDSRNQEIGTVSREEILGRVILVIRMKR